jgi:hypothetical protein
MQYQAVVAREEIIFIDHHGGYQVHNGEGGRLIVLAWRFPTAESRESLSEPVRMELIHYQQGVNALHRRIMSEFPPALKTFGNKLKQSALTPKQGRVIPFQ